MSAADFNQLCVWASTQLGDKTDKDFEYFMKEEFGCRAKLASTETTLPDVKGGRPVSGTGGRTDLFFYIHDDDLEKFAVPRMEYGIRWWEDVLSNGGGVLYEKAVLKKYPKRW